ncbi:MAG: primase-helicase family protein [Candidatus Neomarinimicrobiota bacterium]
MERKAIKDNILYISVCTKYDNKKDKNYNNFRVDTGWLPDFDYPWEEQWVRALTTKAGVSPNVYSDGQRSNETWKAANHIMMDFDDGTMTVDQLLAEQCLWNFNSYVYSSQNHQKEKNGKTCDRLRVLIPLSEPIEDYVDLQAVRSFFTRKYPSLDKSFMDRARYFAHGTDAVSSFVGGKGFLNWKSIPDLNLYYAFAKATTQVWAPKTSKLLSIYDQVFDENLQLVELKDVRPDTSIFCPFCGFDKDRTNNTHNAVIKLNDDGMPFMFCQSCKSRGKGNQGVYNFDPVEGFVYRAGLNEGLLFIDTVKSRYMAGCRETGLDDFVIRDLGSREMVSQFCKYHEIPYPEIFPRARYELVFDSDKLYDFTRGYVNKYTATDYLKKECPPKHAAKLPTFIGKLIDHVLAHDKEIKERFYNDLAWFVQNRKKLITATIMQGVEGTGKGVLFTRVLQPIFGARFCTQTDQDAFGSQFNSFLEENVLVLVNEISGNFSSSEGKNLSTVEKMKIAITDENIQIEGKNKDRVNGKNCCSFLFATNRRHAIILSENDRRFNVAPRQEVKVANTYWWPGFKKLEEYLRSELQEFVWYLKQYPVNAALIGLTVENDPKRVLQLMSQSNADIFFEKVKTGNLTWLWENINKRTGYGADDEYSRIEGILRSLSASDRISTQDLCDLYNNVNRGSGKPLQKVAFGRLAAGHLGKPMKLRINGLIMQGFKIDWGTYDDPNEMSFEEIEKMAREDKNVGDVEDE